MELLSPECDKYKNILQKNPRSKAFARLADIYRKYAMMDEALKILQMGIRYNPKYVPGHLALAHCYYDQGRHELCYSTLKPLVKANRDNFKLQNLFSEVCEDLELWEDALEACKHLQYLSPGKGAWSERMDFLEKKIAPGGKDIGVGQKQALFKEEKLSNFPQNVDEWSELSFFDKKKKAEVREENSLMDIYDKKFGHSTPQEEPLAKVKKQLQNFCTAINKRAASFLSR